MLARSAGRFAAESAGARAVNIPVAIGGATTNINIRVRGLPPVRLGIVPAEGLFEKIEQAIAKVMPATVQIHVVGNNKKEWSGSGFVVDPEDVGRYFPGLPVEPGVYYIHTNQHVAANAKKIITLDGKHEFDAELVRSPHGAVLLDEDGDTALLKVTSDVPLPTAKIGPRKLVKHGTYVLTAGFPLGFPEVSITKGIVSQPAQQTGLLLRPIQADAPINPGNSGGPLFTLDGLVVGTNTYTYEGANDMSFANAIEEQFGILGEIFSKGQIVRGDLGFELEPLGESTRGQQGLPEGVRGAKISDVRKGGPAEKTGLRPGDIVTEIGVIEDGRVVRNIPVNFRFEAEYTSILQEIVSLKPGQEVALTVYLRSIDAKNPYYNPPEAVRIGVVQRGPREGVYASSWGFSVKKGASGSFVINSVRKDSPAYNSLLRGGRWILEGLEAPELADRTPQGVRNLKSLDDMLRALRGSHASQVTLHVKDAADPAVKKSVVLYRDGMKYFAS